MVLQYEDVKIAIPLAAIKYREHNSFKRCDSSVNLQI